MDYSKPRFALFLLLSFALVISARIIPHSENQDTTFMINDYPDPGANPGHDPFQPSPPPSRRFKVSSRIKIPHSENHDTAFMINDYPDPGANPRHDPFQSPPPSQQFKVSVVEGRHISKNP